MEGLTEPMPSSSELLGLLCAPAWGWEQIGETRTRSLFCSGALGCLGAGAAHQSHILTVPVPAEPVLWVPAHPCPGRGKVAPCEK